MISRSKAAEYYDLITLQTMLSIVEDIEFVIYEATMLGKTRQYLNLQELKEWGAANGYNFLHSSQISPEWREYLHTKNRIQRDLIRVRELAEQLNCVGENSQISHFVDREHPQNCASGYVLPQPYSGNEHTRPAAKIEKKIPLSVYQALKEKYEQHYLIDIWNKGIVVTGEHATIAEIHKFAIEFEKTVVCGVYFLSYKGKLVYIGQSIDVLDRIRTHRRTSEFKFDSFSIIPVQREKLNEVEMRYIRRFRPKFNKAGTTSRPQREAENKARSLAMLNTLNRDRG